VDTGSGVHRWGSHYLATSDAIVTALVEERCSHFVGGATVSLREGLIEAAARGISLEDDGRPFDQMPDGIQLLYERMAVSLLDAILDYLQANANEIWPRELFANRKNEPAIRSLLAALRIQENQP
jgi:hypothetical protein